MVQEEVVVAGSEVSMELADSMQEVVVVVWAAQQTEEVAVVVDIHPEVDQEMVALVVVELWLLVTTRQILCP